MAHQSSDLTTSLTRAGQSNSAGDARALYLKLFSGEMFKGFQYNAIARDLVMKRTLKNGKSMQFIYTGRTTAEFHWRFSKIAMLPILMLFALCFSSITYRKARFPGMLTALLIYFTYTNIMGLGVAMIRREVVHPHITLWAINGAFLVLALYLFSRRKRNLRLIPGLKA